MTTPFTTFAEAPGGNMFTSLGIDPKMLIFQGVAFLILVVVIAKWVMPPLIKAVDDRQAKFEASTKAADEAEKKAQEAEVKIEKLLVTARKEATDIVATAREEASAALEAADSKAKSRAEAIVANAHDQTQKDVLAAKKALRNETVDLVALATEKVIGKTVSAKVDDQLINSAVKEAE